MIQLPTARFVLLLDPSGRPHRQDSNDARVSVHQAVRGADQQVGGQASAPARNHGRVAQSPEHLALLGEAGLQEYCIHLLLKMKAIKCIQCHRSQ